MRNFNCQLTYIYVALNTIHCTSCACNAQVSRATDSDLTGKVLELNNYVLLMTLIFMWFSACYTIMLASFWKKNLIGCDIIHCKQYLPILWLQCLSVFVVKSTSDPIWASQRSSNSWMYAQHKHSPQECLCNLGHRYLVQLGHQRLICVGVAIFLKLLKSSRYWDMVMAGVYSSSIFILRTDGGESAKFPTTVWSSSFIRPQQSEANTHGLYSTYK